MRSRTSVLAFVGMLTIVFAGAFAQESTLDFQVSGPADWNTAANWTSGSNESFIPGDSFPDEIVGISNAGTVALNVPASFPVQGILLGEAGHFPLDDPAEEGTLNISAAGNLVVTGAVQIGAPGKGVVNMTGGTANFGSLTVGGADDSALNLSGNAKLNVEGSANLSRTTRITGPNVAFDVSGDLQVGGTFVSEITGNVHSAVNAPTGTARISDTLRVELTGHTPNLGDAWTLINAKSVSGRFAAVEANSQSLPRGGVFEVRYDDGGTGDVTLQVSNRLLLSVNRATGAAMIENPAGDAIVLDGYGIRSALGLLDFSDGAWRSLQDGGIDNWQESNPTANNISELNPTGSSTLSAGDVIDLGTPYRFVPTAFGEAGEDLVLEYRSTSGDIYLGNVEYGGGNANNLVITVDPTTGAAQLANSSSFTIAIDGYSVESPSGSLRPNDGAWLSLDDQMLGDWDEASPSSRFLSELNPVGSTTLLAGASLALGNPFDTNGVQDLSFTFRLTDGTLFDGVVQYGSATDVSGDIDGDGDCDVDDIDALAAAIRNNDLRPQLDLNGDGSVDKSDHGFLVKDVKHTWIGDADLNGEFSSGDFVTVFTSGKYETGEMAGWDEGDWDGNGLFDSGDFVAAFTDGGYELGPRPAANAVPEPVSMSLIGLGGLLALISRRGWP